MFRTPTIKTLLFVLGLLSLSVSDAAADVLCKVKKTGAVIDRSTVCTKKETAIGSLAATTLSNSTAADMTIGTDLTVQDTGAVSSGSDSTVGLDLSVSRLNASGGNLNTTGLNLSVVGDTGGDSTNVGLSVQTSGADTNYCALFQGGNVGIGVSDPDEALEIAGRLHLGTTSTPGDVTDKIYNVGGTLYWSGQKVGLESSGSGSISAVNAGTGLTGGGSSGAVTLAVDAGTTAGKILQLNSSAELPTVSGANLTALNGSNISSGTLSDSRLSGNVSLLGSSIGLSSEVNGILPVANGGTGAATLVDLITLGTHTIGNYIATAVSGTGISVASAGSSEGSALTISVDQSFTPSWSALHSFLSKINVGTSTSSPEALHLNGRMHIEPSSAPSPTTDRLYNVGGSLFFNGQDLTASAAGGDITEVVAGTGLTGGGTSGIVTLNIDTGTTANDIVQLNGSSQLPAVSGVNLTNLNASNLASGTVSDARLSANVSLLGSSIDLASSEVTGTLPVARGGIGATSLADLIALGTHTTGNYVAAVAAGTGITLGSSGAEGGTATLSVNQAFTPTWTGTHTFSGQATDVTTGTNENFAIVPNGTGKIGLGTSNPSAMLDGVFQSADSSAGTESGFEFNATDTGIVTSGTDTLLGMDLNISRSGATGGTINTTGLDIGLTSDTAGAGLSTATGLNVLVGGADTNYSALFNGGSVGIGTTTPSAQLDTVFSSASVTAGTEVGNEFNITDTGAVSTGTDTTLGLDLNVTRTGSSGGTVNTTGLDVNVTGDNGGAGTTTAIGLQASATGADNNYAAIFPSGNVGIGVSAPNSLLSTQFTSAATSAAIEIAHNMSVNDTGVVASGLDVINGLQLQVTRTGATGGTINSNGLVVSVTGDAAGTGASLSTGLSVTVSGSDNNIAASFSGGSVGIGTTSGVLTDSDIVPGSLVIGDGALCVDNANDDCAAATRAAGSIYSESGTVAGIDVAEDFPVQDGDEVLAGEIVVVNTTQAEKCLERAKDANGALFCKRSELGSVPFVTRSSGNRSENKRVLGVVSTRPGLTLGGFGDEQLFMYRKAPIALVGRVPVKISSENGAVEVGDRITPSSAPGVGMRASDGDLAIGIALEEFSDSGVGSVLVLVK